MSRKNLYPAKAYWSPSSLPVLKVLMRQGVPAIDGERFSKHATSVLAGDILQVKIGKKEFAGIRAE